MELKIQGNQKIQPMEGTVMRRTTIFLFHMKRFWVQSPSKVNIIKYLKVSYIDYYMYYIKNLEFDAP